MRYFFRTVLVGGSPKVRDQPEIPYVPRRRSRFVVRPWYTTILQGISTPPSSLRKKSYEERSHQRSSTSCGKHTVLGVYCSIPPVCFSKPSRSLSHASLVGCFSFPVAIAQHHRRHVGSGRFRTADALTGKRCWHGLQPCARDKYVAREDARTDTPEMSLCRDIFPIP